MHAVFELCLVTCGLASKTSAKGQHPHSRLSISAVEYRIGHFQLWYPPGQERSNRSLHKTVVVPGTVSDFMDLVGPRHQIFLKADVVTDWGLRLASRLLRVPRSAYSA